MKIGKYKADEYLELIKEFHGSTAPGMIAGGFMVDLGLRNLPEGEFFDVICETSHCLMDAVQLLTPCTIGNGWLKSFYTSRFAIIIYNKYTGDGVRVYIDTEKLEKWKDIKVWYMKEIDKTKQDTGKIISQLIEAGSEYMSVMKVKVKEEYLAKKKKKSQPVAVCPSCKEVYYLKFGDKCPACSGNIPYDAV
ncbi:MAG: formylmethanofuran dehydrogenase subunit E family protein [Spirochaetes bacterium]|nr:formylmethanofuran dehydrogenase subunit E family protein [Spirochaetota bacterium]